jgi:hypothetical protein
VPDGFEPFPNRPLRGVTQPIGGSGPQDGLIMMRQYVVGLVNGMVPLPHADFFDAAPRLQVRISPIGNHQDWFESMKDSQALEPEGELGFYHWSEVGQSLYVGRDP